MILGKNYFATLLFCAIFLCANLTAQETVPLPMGYRSIELGMSLDATKEALKDDYLFGYRGERDVSLLPTENRTLIETSSDTWLERCWFQFYEDKLYTMIINFNLEKMDYYSVFNELSSKYGEPKSLSPEKVIWQNDDITMSLERPVSVKYVDRPIFESLREQGLVDKATIETVRSGILEGL